jgi:hypothetical protein
MNGLLAVLDLPRGVLRFILFPSRVLNKGHHMPLSPELVEPIALEIRLLDRSDAGYPIEMTLTATQQVFHGYLAADMLPWSATGDARADGQRLFDALFANNPDLREGWGVAKGKSNRRRLRLRIDAVELNALPWELLCDKIDLLAADADTPFSRYLAVSREWGTAIDERPIRILAVISNPIDLKDRYPDVEPADVKAETQALQTAIGSAAQFDFLTAPITLERLESELRKSYHILHFIGHGAFSENKKQAALLMQDADGKVRLVRDVDFAGMLNRLQAPPHLVVLAACQSAQQSTSAAFTGLGPQLVQIGLPAVIAMQENVTVVTARQFAATFYGRLLEHGTVDLAMNEARGTLITNGRFDAAVPVLFMRLPDGRLWDVTTLQKKSSARSATVADDDSKSRSGGVNISGNTKVGGGIYQADKISKIDNRTINRSGGTDIDASGGTVNITGDVVGRDKITTTITNTGLSAADFAKAFDVIYQRIAAKPVEDQTDIRDAVDAIKAEAKKEAVDGKQPDEKMVKLSAQALVTTAPELLRDIADVALATLTSPAAGVMAIIHKVLEKARA